MNNQDLFGEMSAKERLTEAILDAIEQAEEDGGMSKDDLANLIAGEVWVTLKDIDPADLGLDEDTDG